MGLLDPQRPPPPHYYASRVCKLLAGVADQYSDLLDADERQTIARVRRLSVDALRLFARLWSRTGPVFRIDTLSYREVEDTAAALAELAEAELIQINGGCPVDKVLARLTRVEIDDLFGSRRCVAKRVQIGQICGHYPERLIRQRVAARTPWCTLACEPALARLSLLFFGGSAHDLATFVLEDLGVVRFEGYTVDHTTRQFESRSAIDRYLELTELGRWTHDLEGGWHGELAQHVLEQLWHAEPSRTLERRRARILNQLGRRAERAKDFDLALGAYARALQPPARERTVRILDRLGDRHAAATHLASIAARPIAATERVFSDGYGRRRPRLSEDRLQIAASPAASVESAVLEHFVEVDNEVLGRHLENRLPLGMLGLAFWREVFAPVRGAFVNAYQAAPLDLYWQDFRNTRRDLIDARLAEYRCATRLRSAVWHAWRHHHGISSALVNWSAFDEVLIERLLRDIPAAHWCLLFDYMLDDLRQTRTGFPDLVLLYGSHRYEFIEVKGPGDQIRPEQRIWFEFFQRHRIPARVLRVSW